MTDIDKLTIGEVKQLTALLNFNSGPAQPSSQPATDHPFVIGTNYLIRTVTMIQTGRLVRVTPTELVLEDAAWIADTGRFSQSLISCDFSEVEPFPDGAVIVGRGALVDAVQIPTLPRKQK